MTTPAAELRRVRLLGLPVPVHFAAAEHADELLREFTLIAEQLSEEGADGAHPVPPRLVKLVEQLSDNYGTLNEEAEAALEEARRSGRSELDVEMTLPVNAVDDVEQLGRMLDEADDYCRAGRHLLTLATPPAALRYRRWYLGEVAGQLRGAPATRWRDFRG